MKILVQLAILFGIAFAGQAIAMLLPIPFPASVIGMLILLALLLFKVIRPEQIDLLADFLLKNMSILFIPAAVGIMGNFEYIKDSLAAFFLICVFSMIVTFLATAFTVKAVLHLQEQLRRKKV